MLILLLAPVAQLDRAVDYGSAGCVFDSRRAHANFTQIYALVVKFSIPHLPLEMVERDYLGVGFFSHSYPLLKAEKGLVRVWRARN